MNTYSEELYKAMDGETECTTYTFSDGDVWTRTVQDNHSRVWRQGFVGDTSRRSTLKALKAKLSGAERTDYSEIDGVAAIKDDEPVRMWIN